MGAFQEGRMYRNPKTGQMLVRQNGGWVKAPENAQRINAPDVVGVPRLQSAQYAGPDPSLTPDDQREQQPMGPDVNASRVPQAPQPPQGPSGPSNATSVEPQMGVSPEYTKTLDKYSGKNDADYRNNSRDAAMTAVTNLPSLDDIENLVQEAPVGPYASIAKAWGAAVPDGWYGSKSDDQLGTLRSKVLTIVIPMAKMLKPVSNFDMESLIKTIGDEHATKAQYIEALKILRREGRAAVYRDGVLQTWINRYGSPNAADDRGRTFTQAYGEWYNDPRTIKKLEAPGQRVSDAKKPRAQVEHWGRDRNGNPVRLK